METKKEYIDTCEHDKHIYSLGTRWCDNGYEQNLYDCKNCPGYEPIGEVEITTNSTHEDCEPIYIEVKDSPFRSDEIIEEKIRNYYIYGRDINLHIEKTANNIDYVKK